MLDEFVAVTAVGKNTPSREAFQAKWGETS